MIDTKKWKEFELGKIFTVTRGQRQKKTDRIDGNTPYYSASDFNNGKTDSISNPTFIEQDAIICTTFGASFYVEGIFTASDEITILKHPMLNKYNGLFIATIIKKNKHKYSFGIKAFSTRIKKDTVILPIDSIGEPDWEYMEIYIKNFRKDATRKLNLLRVLRSSEYTPLPIETWGNFLVESIFEKVDAKFKADRKFSRTNDLSLEQNNEFDLPLTNAKHGNNGIMYYGRSEEWNSVTKSIDVVTNGAKSVGNVYYQPQATAVIGDSFLMKLKEDYQEYENDNILLFLTTVLERSIKHKYSYDHKSTWNRVKKEYIKLPVDNNMNIDWDYIEKYLEQLNQKVEKHFNSFTNIVI